MTKAGKVLAHRASLQGAETEMSKGKSDHILRDGDKCCGRDHICRMGSLASNGAGVESAGGEGGSDSGVGNQGPSFTL